MLNVNRLRDVGGKSHRFDWGFSRLWCVSSIFKTKSALLTFYLDDDEDAPSYIIIDDDESTSGRSRDTTPELPERIQIEHVVLACGLVIRSGDVVELKEAGHRPRGDFLLVQTVKECLQTEETFLSGYTLRRTIHFGPSFNSECILLANLVFANYGYYLW